VTHGYRYEPGGSEAALKAAALTSGANVGGRGGPSSAGGSRRLASDSDRKKGSSKRLVPNRSEDTVYDKARVETKKGMDSSPGGKTTDESKRVKSLPMAKSLDPPSGSDKKAGSSASIAINTGSSKVVKPGSSSGGIPVVTRSGAVPAVAKSGAVAAVAKSGPTPTLSDTSAIPTSAAASAATKINASSKKSPSSVQAAPAVTAGAAKPASGISPALVIGGVVAAVFVIVTVVVIVLMSLGDGGGAAQPKSKRSGVQDTSDWRPQAGERSHVCQSLTRHGSNSSKSGESNDPSSPSRFRF
jgi:hypothetical protein